MGALDCLWPCWTRLPVRAHASTATPQPRPFLAQSASHRLTPAPFTREQVSEPIHSVLCCAVLCCTRNPSPVASRQSPVARQCCAASVEPCLFLTAVFANGSCSSLLSYLSEWQQDAVGVSPCHRIAGRQGCGSGASMPCQVRSQTSGDVRRASSAHKRWPRALTHGKMAAQVGEVHTAPRCTAATRRRIDCTWSFEKPRSALTRTSHAAVKARRAAASRRRPTSLTVGARTRRLFTTNLTRANLWSCPARQAIRIGTRDSASACAS